MQSDQSQPVARFPLRYRFRLRTMLIAVTLICAICGFLSIRVHHLLEIYALGDRTCVRLDTEGNPSLGHASYVLGKGKPPHPIFGRLLEDIQKILFADLEYLIVFDRREGVTRLSQLRLDRFPQLKGILSAGTGIVDEDLQAVAELFQLEELSFEDTAVSDNGLKHLSRLTALKSVDLRNTSVTDQGVRQLQETLPNCQIIYE